jgi:hypothetical protein
LTRSRLVLRIRRGLERDSFPRVQMGFIVFLTGAAGLLGSYLFLRAGVDSMALRYPLALLSAYLFFLFLLWVWLRSSASDYVDSPDPSNVDPGFGSDGTPDGLCSGGGGDFAGGGASGSFDSPDSSSVVDSSMIPDVDVDAGEFVVPILAIVLALGLALASLYVVYIAPELFAELLLDGALSYTLYRRLTVGRRGNWFGTAVRRTVLPFGLTAVFLGAVGAAMAHYDPEARSVGQVIHHAGNRR